MASQLPGDVVGDPALLDKIEKLLAAGLGHHVDLPQLVIWATNQAGNPSCSRPLPNFRSPEAVAYGPDFQLRSYFERQNIETEGLLPLPSSRPLIQSQGMLES